MSDQNYGQMPYPPQPPKKSRKTLWIVLGVIFGVMILGCGGCLAIVGVGANEVDKAIREEEANDAPHEIEVGQEFEHDDYTANAGWKITNDGLDDFTIEGLKVTNNAEDARSAFLTITLYKGNEVIGSIDCSSNELQSGDAGALDCTSTDDFTEDYDTAKVADAF